MVQLLTQLLMKDIVFPFASEIVGAAMEMKEKCKEHKTGPMKDAWKTLDKELYALMNEAEDKEIDGKTYRHIVLNYIEPEEIKLNMFENMMRYLK